MTQPSRQWAVLSHGKLVPSDMHRLDAKTWKDRDAEIRVVTPECARAKVEEAVAHHRARSSGAGARHVRYSKAHAQPAA